MPSVFRHPPSAISYELSATYQFRNPKSPIANRISHIPHPLSPFAFSLGPMGSAPCPLLTSHIGFSWFRPVFLQRQSSLDSSCCFWYKESPDFLNPLNLLHPGYQGYAWQWSSELYGVETKQLKRAVRRNTDRFPQDFMFELTKEEHDSLRYQFGTLKRGEHSKYLPMAFTEQGLAMFTPSNSKTI